jgi:hypothetical protein
MSEMERNPGSDREFPQMQQGIVKQVVQRNSTYGSRQDVTETLKQSITAVLQVAKRLRDLLDSLSQCPGNVAECSRVNGRDLPRFVYVQHQDGC